MKKPPVIKRLSVPKPRKDGSAVFSQFFTRLEKAFRASTPKATPTKPRTRRSKR